MRTLFLYFFIYAISVNLVVLINIYFSCKQMESMKKLLLSALMIFAINTHSQAKDDTWFGKEPGKPKDGSWFGKERGTAGVEVSVTYVNNETNIKNSIHTTAQSMEHIINLDDHTHLCITLHRTEDKKLILHGYITKKEFPILPNSDDFRFKARINTRSKAWFATRQKIQFTYGKWTIHLSAGLDLLGYIKIASLAFLPKEKYNQKSTIELIVQKNKINQLYSAEKQIERHFYSYANPELKTWEKGENHRITHSTMHSVNLEALKSDKKIKAKFLISDAADIKEFTRVKLFDPEKKATYFSHSMCMKSRTSDESLDAKMVIE